MAERRKPTMIAVAGPKGGVGKSFLALNLAVALAGRGVATVLVDLDLGAANLHALLGMSSPRPGFLAFANKEAELIDLVRTTPVEGLKLVAGSTDSLGLANLLQWQKVKLLSQLGKLPTQVIVADLGAGSAYNTLDFYAAADLGVIVSSPEMPSLLNAYAFVKSLIYRDFYRILKPKRLAAARRLVEAGQASVEASGEDVEQLTIPEIMARIEGLDQEAGAKLKAALDGIRPRMILNQTDGVRQLKAGQALTRLMARRLGVELSVLGLIPFDPLVRRSVGLMKPLLAAYPDSPAAQGLGVVIDRLLPLILPEKDD